MITGPTMRKLFRRLGIVPGTIACVLAAFWVFGLPFLVLRYRITAKV